MPEISPLAMDDASVVEVQSHFAHNIPPLKHFLKCILYGNACNAPLLVSVPVLSELEFALDLSDLFAAVWFRSPNPPFPNVVLKHHIIDDFRGFTLPVSYVFLFVDDTLTIEQHPVNQLLERMTAADAPVRGSVLVCKRTMYGDFIPMEEADMNLVDLLLESHVASLG
ncbi:hypothetical protein HGRIS_005784 [Hohenbuehelia grisea]|uniref:Uncharacterized protein n=1 Tax=Hohenbuehelia grisea TaxID=104357 RepID=A0ABR3JY47_9AGAR